MLLDKDAEDEKEYKKEMAEKFKPLLTWIKEQAGDVVRDGELLSELSMLTVSTHLTLYSCDLEQACH